ncbi:MAG: hypothetical protein JF606_27425 [Burkholderiales bacterium]|nr:hypothetical protein [Burkholderiales bacterium]
MKPTQTRSVLRQGALIAVLLSSFVAGCAAGPSTTESKERQAKAQALFAERCKTAGEKIYRTVDNVEGIYLLKLRPQGVNFGDQFKLDDPYGSDSSGDTYILNFLRGFYHQRATPPIPGAPPQLGYPYVEAIDPKDGQRYRYTGGVREVEVTSSILVGGTGKQFKTKAFVLDKSPATGSAPRYGVTYDDISTHEEREYWIAGSSLKVIDLQTNEVIAERVGYMVDVYQGSQAGGRSPWLFAADHACPGFQTNPLRPLTAAFGGGSSAQPGQTLFFVEKVLHPIREQQ